MKTSIMNPKVDWFFAKATKWQLEYETLRQIVLECGLTEELKWGCPCYSFEKKNIVLIHGFKDYCAFLFFKGVLLKDTKGILIQQTPNVQVPRQVRFRSVKEITKLKPTLKAYIKEAIELEKAGVKVALKKTAEYKMPVELQKVLTEMPDIKTAFKALTPGRQRGYIYYISQPKQSKTREARITKSIPKILKGKGWDD